MFRTCVNAQFFDHLATEGVFRKHAFHSVVNGKFRLFGHKFFILSFFQTADVTGVITIHFLFEFFAGQSDFCAVDDDDMIACIDVRSESRFVFASEHCGNLACQTTENEVGSIHNVLFSFDVFRLCHISFHGKDLQKFLIIAIVKLLEN